MNWKQKAFQAKREGYVPGQWQRMLDRHLRQFFPELVQELGPEYQDYLVSQVYDNLLYHESLLSNRFPPESARELALESLLPRTPDEIDQPTSAEVEDFLGTLVPQVERRLETNPSQKPPAKKTPPT